MAKKVQPEPPASGRMVVLEGIEVRTELHAFGYVTVALAKPRPETGGELWCRSALLHPDEAEDLSARLHELAERGKRIRAERAPEAEAPSCP